MQVWVWTAFLIFIVSMLLIDLLVINRGDRVIPIKRALAFTGVTILLSLAFGAAVYLMYDRHWFAMGLGEGGESFSSGRKAAEDFFQGWLLEYSLSVDNLFVFALIFEHFKVPARHQHRVLFWGIIGALVMRGVMIVAGVALVRAFEPILYVMGAFLVYTAIKFLRSDEEQFEPEKSWLVRFSRKLFPVSPSFDGHNFLTRLADGRRAVTPLFLVLVVVDFADAVFAVDSIPAVFGVTRDPFIIFSSNIFAILGLRSLYFALAGLMDRFRFLKVSLSAVLAFVGIKMIVELPIPAWGYGGVHIPGAASLGFILLCLALGITASWLIPPAPPKDAHTSAS